MNSKIDTHFIEDVAAREQVIREEIAKKLACKMIDEDLIQIYTEQESDPGVYKVKAVVKFIQE